MSNKNDQINKYGQWYDCSAGRWKSPSGEGVAPPPFSAFGGVNFGGMTDPRYTPEEEKKWHDNLEERKST